MSNMLKKEMKLSASILSYLFIAFGFMTMIPGYPILLGAFFTTLGIFQTFQSMRENNDTVYSALLPVQKKDVVRGRYTFVIFIEMCSFAIMVIMTLLRMTAFADSAVYRANAMMNANLVFLGFALLIFGCFNSVFVGGFYKTAFYFGKPFVTHIIIAFIIVFIAEALHHVPGLEAVNAFGFEHIGLQLAFLIAGAAAFIILTVLSLKRSERNFEKIDL